MSAEALLAADEVTFGYPRGEPVVRGWSVGFPGGSMTALTGPSGCGKSTSLYLLGLMLRPAAGAVRFHGEPVHGLSDRARARLRAYNFGFVFQDSALDPTRTVLDNVVETALYRGQPRREAVASAHQLLERFDVELRAQHRPGQISGGQAQRIALCRALLARPQVVLADEPTGNLDPTTSAVVVAALREHASSGAAVVIATHDHTVADACDSRITMGSAR